MKKRLGDSSESMHVADNGATKKANKLITATSARSEVNELDEDALEASVDIKNANLGQNSRRAYLRELRKVVSTADVILQVLDAR